MDTRHLHDPSFEQAAVDPRMVGHLMQAIALAIDQAKIPEVTTTADILSAIFTTLDHTLRVVQAHQEPGDTVYNAKEIGRVLSELLLEFGSSPTITH